MKLSWGPSKDNHDYDPSKVSQHTPSMDLSRRLPDEAEQRKLGKSHYAYYGGTLPYGTFYEVTDSSFSSLQSLQDINHIYSLCTIWLANTMRSTVGAKTMRRVKTNANVCLGASKRKTKKNHKAPHGNVILQAPKNAKKMKTVRQIPAPTRYSIRIAERRKREEIELRRSKQWRKSRLNLNKIL